MHTQATVEHRSAGRAVAVGLSGKKWELWHDFAKKASSMVVASVGCVAHACVQWEQQ